MRSVMLKVWGGELRKLVLAHTFGELYGVHYVHVKVVEFALCQPHVILSNIHRIFNALLTVVYMHKLSKDMAITHKGR